MKLSGFKATAFKNVNTMVEAHDGHFDRADENKNLIFTFSDADGKHDCFDAIVSLNLMNVTIDKVDGLHLQVTI